MDNEMMDAPSISFDHSANGYPRSVERLQSEIYLLKDKGTSKQVIEIPAEHIDAPVAKMLAAKLKLKLIKEGDAYYLANPTINMTELRKAVQNGEHGDLLGYGCANCPDSGVDYAISVNGEGTTDPQSILEMRNNNTLGFAGRAPTPEHAAAKIQEMGAALSR